jgi:hypothetical protein
MTSRPVYPRQLPTFCTAQICRVRATSGNLVRLASVGQSGSVKSSRENLRRAVQKNRQPPQLNELVGGAEVGTQCVRIFDKNCRARSVIRIEAKALSTKPVARAGSAASGLIDGICPPALGEPVAHRVRMPFDRQMQTLKLGNHLIDAFRPCPRKTRPVLARGAAICGKQRTGLKVE